MNTTVTDGAFLVEENESMLGMVANAFAEVYA